MERFIHLFNSQSELNEAYESSGYTEPWLACVFNEGEAGSGISYNKKSQFNGHDYVDFGLTSGTLWATCNVGASSPEEVGDYFAYGETRTKSTYTLNNYRYYNSQRGEFTKYNNSDYKCNLDITDDAANIVMGGDWIIPSTFAFQELFESTNTGETTMNGVSGVGFTSKTDSSKSIFIPYCDYKHDDDSSIVPSENDFFLMASNLIDGPNYSVNPTIVSKAGYTATAYSRGWGYKVRGIVSLTLDLSDRQYPIYGQEPIELGFDEIKRTGTDYITYVREPDGKIHNYFINSSCCWRELSNKETEKLGNNVLRFIMLQDKILWDVCNSSDLGFGGE